MNRRFPASSFRARLAVEPLEDRVTPSWGSVPPSSVVVPTSFSPVLLSSIGDASGSADVAANEIDWYRLVAPVAGSYRFGAHTGISGLDSVLGVYGSTGSRVAYNDNVSTTDRGSAVTVTLSVGKTYYIGVTNLTGSSGGGYVWSVDGPAVPDDAYEDNDTAATGYDLGRLPLARTISALKLTDAADYFRFTTLATGVTGNLASISFSSSAGNLDLRLYDVAGNLLGTSATTSGTETISLVGRPAGDYLLGVTGFNGAINAAYTVSLKVPVVDDAFEENDLRTTARDLGTVNSPATFANLVLADADWYKITTTAVGNAGSAVAVDFNHALGNVELALYNAAGSLVRSSLTTTNSEFISLNGLAAGTYYVDVYAGKGLTNPNYTLAVSPPVAGGNWYASNLTDGELRELVASLNSDGSLSRADWLDLFEEVADDGRVSGTEFNDLRVVAGNVTVIGMSAPVRNLSQKVVQANAANAKYLGGTLGNLAAGDGAGRLNNLVNKWFLGLDHPIANGEYVEAAGSLFGNGGPSYDDIQQGTVGDCYLLAALGGLVRQNEADVTQMFLDNGDGTFTVRFYRSGVADYVTVDRYLPATGDGTFLYANVGRRLDDQSNVLWVALAEKAYVQENEAGGWGQEVAANSYISIEGGSPGLATTQITARANLYATTTGLTFAAVKAKFDAGQTVVFGSKSTPASGVVPNHTYTVVDYNETTQTVLLFNPWGSGNVNPPGMLTLTISQIVASFSGYWYA